MSFGISVTNAAGKSVIDADSLCLHFSGVPSLSFNDTPDQYGLRTHILNDTADDFVFIKSDTGVAVNGIYSSSAANIENTSVVTNTEYVDYIKARTPTSASGYGFAVYDASGRLTYTASENLLSIKGTRSFVTYNQEAVAGYPSDFENLFGTQGGVRLHSPATFDPNNPNFKKLVPKNWNFSALSSGGLAITGNFYQYEIRRGVFRVPATEDFDQISILDLVIWRGGRGLQPPYSIISGNPDIFMIFVSI